VSRGSSCPCNAFSSYFHDIRLMSFQGYFCCSTCDSQSSLGFLDQERIWPIGVFRRLPCPMASMTPPSTWSMGKVRPPTRIDHIIWRNLQLLLIPSWRRSTLGRLWRDQACVKIRRQQTTDLQTFHSALHPWLLLSVGCIESVSLCPFVAVTNCRDPNRRPLPEVR